MTLRPTYVSTYPPRRCGIAEYTRDLRTAVAAGGAVAALIEPGQARDGRYPDEVIATLDAHDRAAYRRLAHAIDRSATDVVSLQHEYGLFGGDDGEAVITFTEALEAPLVVTLHTVLEQPTHRQRRIIEALAGRADAVVVLSQSASDRLGAAYAVDDALVRVVPHGVPVMATAPRQDLRDAFGLTDTRTALSFGLVGPGKGFEHAINAMASVRAVVPNALYVILGATHPNLIASEGERYRRQLEDLVGTLGLETAVRFVDRFVDEEELGQWLRAADVFVTPYPNLDQIVSGTLAFALGAGRAIVSTPYAYAAEVLADGAGILVPPDSPTRLAGALTAVLSDDRLRESLETSARRVGASMAWPLVGARYAAVFEAAARPPASKSVERRIVEPVGA